MTYISPDRFIEENSVRLQQLQRDTAKRRLLRLANSEQPRQRSILCFALGALLSVPKHFRGHVHFIGRISPPPSRPTTATTVES